MLSIPKQNDPLNTVSKEVNSLITVMVSDKAATFLQWFSIYLNEIPFLLDTQDTDPVLLPNGSSLNYLSYMSTNSCLCSFMYGFRQSLGI